MVMVGGGDGGGRCEPFAGNGRNAKYASSCFSARHRAYLLKKWAAATTEDRETSYKIAKGEIEYQTNGKMQVFYSVHRTRKPSQMGVLQPSMEPLG